MYDVVFAYLDFSDIGRPCLLNRSYSRLPFMLWWFELHNSSCSSLLPQSGDDRTEVDPLGLQRGLAMVRPGEVLASMVQMDQVVPSSDNHEKICSVALLLKFVHAWPRNFRSELLLRVNYAQVSFVC